MKLKLIAITVIVTFAGLALTACGGTAVTLSPPAPTAPAATTPAAAPALKVVAVPAPAQNVYVPVQAAPPALTNCGGGVYAGADTSCPFALNVAANYTGAGADDAYSPVTGLSYTMSCNGGFGAGDTVTCTGGDNALVEFTG